MKQHADFNNSSIPWHESEPEKRLFLQGFSCIQGPTRRMGLGGTEQEGIALRSEGTKEDAFHEDVEVDLIGVRLYMPLRQPLRLLKY